MKSLNAKDLIREINDNIDTGREMVLIRIDGRDFVGTKVKASFDGVVGQHVVVDAIPLSEVV